MAYQVRTFGRCVWDSGLVLANLWTKLVANFSRLRSERQATVEMQAPCVAPFAG